MATSRSVEGKQTSQVFKHKLKQVGGRTYIKIIEANLTNKVLHHLWCVVRSWSNAQQLIPPSNGGVIDGLHVDIMATHHDVTHLCVLLRVGHLQQLKHTDMM